MTGGKGDSPRKSTKETRKNWNTNYDKINWNKK